MKDRFDIRRRHFLLGAVTALMLVAQFLAGPAGIVPLQAVGAILFLAANAFLLSRVVNYFSTGINFAAPLLFTSVALSFPGFLTYDAGLISALLLNLSMFCAMRFFSGEISNDIIFLSTMAAGAASLFFPPLMWMLPALLLLDFAPAGDKGRYIAMAVSGFLLPLLFFEGYTFITDGYREVLNHAGEYLSSCMAPNFGFASTSAARAIKVLVLAVLFIAAAVSYFRNSSAYSVTHSRASFMLLIYSVIMAVLLALFSSGNMLLNVTALAFPVTTVIYDYFTVSGTGRTGRAAFCFVLLAVVLEFLAHPLSL